MTRSLRRSLLALLAASTACATVPSRVELVSPGAAPTGDPLDLVVGGAKVRCHVTARAGVENRPVSSQDCGLEQTLELTLPPGAYEVVVEIPCQAKAVTAFSVGELGAPVRVTMPRPPMVSLPRFVLADGELPALPGGGASALQVKRGDPVTVIRLWQDGAGACKSAVVTGPDGGLLVSNTDALAEAPPAAPTVKLSSTSDQPKRDRKTVERTRAQRAAREEWVEGKHEELRRLARFPEGTSILEPKGLCAVYGAQASARLAGEGAQERLVKAERTRLRGQTFYLVIGFRPGADALLRGDVRCEAEGNETIEARFKTRRGLPAPASSPATTEWLALASLDGTTSEITPSGEVQLPVLRLLALVKDEP